jgi:hypothetical protein
MPSWHALDNDCTFEQSKDRAILYANTITLVAKKNPFYKRSEKNSQSGAANGADLFGI